MRKFLLIPLILFIAVMGLYLAVIMGDDDAPELSPAPLEVPEDDGRDPILYSPVFVTSEGVVRAGTAFVIEHSGKYFAVTAQHLLGTAGGMEKDYLGRDLEGLLSKVRLDPFDPAFNELTTQDFIIIPDAASQSSETAEHDVFIAHLEKVDSKPFRLATSKPKAGDRVTLYASVSSTTELMHTAIVDEYAQDMIIYIYDDPSIQLPGSSGAPVLNEKGEVVGINVAGGKYDDGTIVGIANPYEQILKHLGN